MTKRSPKRHRPPAAPDFIPPMLASLRSSPPAGPEWLHEIKFDGYRIQVQLAEKRARLLTRRGLDWTDRFGPLAARLARLEANDAVLDGEVVVENAAGLSDFAALQEALAAGAADRFVIHVFDLLWLNGEDLRPLPLIDRQGRLQELLGALDPEGPVRLSAHVEGDGGAMYRHACRLGLEGIISKRADSPYRSGRGDAWLKAKCALRQEFVIIGFTPSSARPASVGSLVLGLNRGGRLTHVGRVGTGFTSRSAADLFSRLTALGRPDAPAAGVTRSQGRGVRWVAPDLVAEVEFRGWGSEGLVRQASFKGLREDKDPADIVEEGTPSDSPALPSSPPPSADRPEETAGVRLTHPDRVLWPGQGLTKQGLADFHAAIADHILPHLVDRPLSLVRCPSGTDGACFYAKHAWAGLHPSIRRVAIEEAGRRRDYLAIDDLTGLIAMVQMGVLEIHPWGSRGGDLERPDRMIFDLDPDEGLGWTQVVAAAGDVRDALAARGLRSWVKTTGGKGLHVVCPIVPEAEWDSVKAFTRRLCEQVARDHPGRYTTQIAKRARQGRIFLDYLRNGRGATAVAAYSTRARPGAPVSTPIAWAELESGITPSQFTVATLPRRLDRLGTDPWEGFFSCAQKLPLDPP